MSDCHSTSLTTEIFPRKKRLGEIKIAPPPQAKAFALALVGNPNAGKTTLFNALTGLRAKTANFPGTTVEQLIGKATLGRQEVLLVDLPGLYSLGSSAPEEKLAADALRGSLPCQPVPNAMLIVVDATNLERNLFLVGEVLELKRRWQSFMVSAKVMWNKIERRFTILCVTRCATITRRFSPPQLA